MVGCAGIAECRRRFPGHRLTVLWLGSSVGNLAPQDAVHFFRTMAAGAGSDLQVCNYCRVDMVMTSHAKEGRLPGLDSWQSLSWPVAIVTSKPFALWH